MTDTVRSLDLNHYLPCRLAAVSSAVIRSVASVFEDRYDISIPEWKVLDTVARLPRLAAVDVAQRAGLDTVAVSRAVTKLMDAGYICREFGREDRRRSILEVSEEGRKLHEQITPMAAKLEARLFEDLSDDEVRLLGTALESLSAKSQEFAVALEASKSEAAVRKDTHAHWKTVRRPLIQDTTGERRLNTARVA